MPLPALPIFAALGLGSLLFLGKKKTPDASKPAELAPVKDGGRAVTVTAVSDPSNDGLKTGVVTAVQTPAVVAPVPELVDLVPSATTPEQVQAATEALDSAQSRQWRDAVIDAIRSGDAQTVEAVAATMALDGLKDEAATVRAIAAQWRQEAAEAASAAAQQTVTETQVEAAELPPPVPPANPAREAAAELAAYLKNWSPWKEDKEIVRALQIEMGAGNDGKYGPGTATAIADFGIIPPAPYYWPAVSTNTYISRYRAMLEAKAVADPAREALWLKAAAQAVR